MKKIIIICFVAMIGLSACGISSYQCPAYSHHNKKTSYGHRAQNKYHKLNSKKRSQTSFMALMR